jgi:uncharacterized membrane protein
VHCWCGFVFYDSVQALTSLIAETANTNVYRVLGCAIALPVLVSTIMQAELLSRHIVKFEAIVRDLEAPPVAVAPAAQAAY